MTREQKPIRTCYAHGNLNPPNEGTMTFRRDRDLREVKPVTKTDDAQFIRALAKGLQAQDAETETTPESREELKKRIRSEVLHELHQRLVVKPAPPEPPPRAGFVRDPSLDKFFELAAEEKAARRRRGH
jgi:hypothetical protein